MDGWPIEKKYLPHHLGPYFPYQDEVAIQVGLVLRGKQIVISTTLQQTHKNGVHSSHLEMEGCLRRANERFSPEMHAIVHFDSVADVMRTVVLCLAYRPVCKYV